MKKQIASLFVLSLLLIATNAGAQGTINNSSIGLTTPQAGKFTNLEATTQITLGAETITNFSGIDDDKVKVSGTDTADYLETQITAGTGVTVSSDGSQITISAPPVSVEDSADGVEVTYAGLGEYDPGTGVVPALDLNGTNLVVNQTNPTVTVGGITSTVLASSETPQQVIVRVPQGLNAGNYKLKVKNANGFSEGLIPLNQTFFDGSTWTEATSAAAWSARQDHTSVVFDNKIWILGGLDNTVTEKNDVWHSSDGITWTQATASAGWSARYAHISLVYDNKMWVMGGRTVAGTFYNDVWSSADGITWTQATASAGWSVRNDLSGLVFNGKMWVLGGNDGSTQKNDVWSSADGITWTQATASAGWSARANHTTVVFNDGSGEEIWVMGGLGGSTKYNDVWKSSNGINWSLVTSSSNWSARFVHASVVYGNKMWVLGGNNGNRINDVWHSSDGVSWTQETSNANWSVRHNHSSVVHNNKIWVLGGSSSSEKNDVWFTSE